MSDKGFIVKRILKVFFLIISLFIICISAVSYGVYSYFAKDMPSLKTLEEYNPNIVTKVYSDDGQVIGEFYIERRIVIPLSSMPKHLTDAFLAAEDARFFKHEGIDYMSIMRAFYKNLFAGKIVQAEAQ